MYSSHCAVLCVTIMYQWFICKCVIVLCNCVYVIGVVVLGGDWWVRWGMELYVIVFFVFFCGGRGARGVGESGGGWDWIVARLGVRNRLDMNSE